MKSKGTQEETQNTGIKMLVSTYSRNYTSASTFSN